MAAVVSLKAAAETDVPAMLAIYAPLVLNSSVSFEYEAPSLAEFRERFRRISGRYPWLKAEVDGRTAGYAYASTVFERAAYQWTAGLSVYIAADHQRLGLASKLCGALEELLRQMGYRILYAVISADNSGSLSFHHRLGFKEVGRFRRAGFKLGQWRDVVWMEKILNPAEGPPLPPIAFSALDETTKAGALAK
ncbi:MAG: GNAT family N-acetyltransferase [Candidatus Adiutrix sp.]|jgi:phosphinothricin acetyltransferase|nr:GNAT family N-acetyltransferase [Candidatus Adiutrix sp.]